MGAKLNAEQIRYSSETLASSIKLPIKWSQREQEMLKPVLSKHIVGVSYVTKDNYTMVEIKRVYRNRTTSYTGFAKMRPTDKPDPVIGFKVAWWRAAREMMNVQRKKTIDG